MIVRKAFQFRLRLTKKQKKALNDQLNECRWLYNYFLEQRILAYQDLGIALSKYQQAMMLPFLKEERSSLNQVHSQVLQNVLDRLDKGFQAFFRRSKKGEKAGFPRFRGMHRYNSFCFPQSGFSLIGKEVGLSKVGKVRLKMHRPIEGDIKTCTLIQNASHEWDISFSCEVQAKPLELQDTAVGMDMGLETFATLSDSATIENPRFLKHGEKKLAKVQRKLSKLQKGTKERRHQGIVVAKTHERIKNQRKDFCHKESRKIIQNYQYICVEDLNIKKMMEKSYLAKSIADASWNQFLEFLTYKAEEAGRTLKFVNPAYTTQDCSKCGHREAKELSDREHHCTKCKYRVPRDFNSAENILALGLDGLGFIPRSLRL